MKVAYDNYYQSENLFGEPYPELIEFFANFPKKGKVLDLGCGQGRDAIALARLGFEVIGIDNSKVGIDQMNKIAKDEKLDLVGYVDDIFNYNRFDEFDIILLDSMFHFAKKDMEKEVGMIKRIVSDINVGCLIVVCIQNTGNKVEILNSAVDFETKRKRRVDIAFKYTFEDSDSGHKSETDYKMIAIEK